VRPGVTRNEHQEADGAVLSNSPASATCAPASAYLSVRQAGGSIRDACQKNTDAVFEQLVVEPTEQIWYVYVPLLQIGSV